MLHNAAVSMLQNAAVSMSVLHCETPYTFHVLQCAPEYDSTQWWGDFSQLQIQFKPKSQFESVPRDTWELKIKSKFQFDFVP